MNASLPPALFLFFMGSYTAEILSGATPPIAVLLNPLALVYLWTLYGSGAILIREMTIRWKKGWPTVLMLGAAYALLEEAITTKVIFDPDRTDLSPLVNYGRVGEVNVPFAEQLVIYHAVVSIGVPILMAHLVFPERKHETWVRTSRFWALAVLLCAAVLLGTLAVFPYTATPGNYLGTLVIIIMLGVAARFMPAQLPVRDGRVRRPRELAMIAFLATALFFFASFGFPGFGIPSGITMLVLAAVAGVAGRIILNGSGNAHLLSARHQLGLVTGVLGFFVFFGFFQELLGNVGMSLVGLSAVVLLVWLRRRVSATAGNLA